MRKNDIDELYSKLGIQSRDDEIRNTINKGSLKNKLNINYSAVTGCKQNKLWNNRMK